MWLPGAGEGDREANPRELPCQCNPLTTMRAGEQIANFGLQGWAPPVAGDLPQLESMLKTRQDVVCVALHGQGAIVGICAKRLGPGE